MEEKKKVKSILSSDKKEESKKVIKKPKVYVKDPVVVDDYKTKSKLKYIAIFMLGIIATIALFSIIGSVTGKGISVGGDISSGVNKISDATVYIENYDSNKLSVSGTGFVYKKSKTKAYILTNYHVVSGNTSLKVTFSDNSTTDASFVGGNQYSDVAVISVPSKKVKQVAAIGSSKKMSLGDAVFTISNLGKNYRGTVMHGILSGKDRLVNVSTNGSNDYVMKLIQTDAAISSDNSGAPLCNTNGEVIGMYSSKLVKDSNNGMGFVISIEDIMSRISTYEKGTSNSKPYIGISMVNLEDTNSMSYYGLSKKINTKLTKGVVVENVNPNTAAAGKLEEADIIVRFNEVSVDNISYLRYELYKYNVGDKVNITVERNGKLKTVALTLGEKKGN